MGRGYSPPTSFSFIFLVTRGLIFLAGRSGLAQGSEPLIIIFDVALVQSSNTLGLASLRGVFCVHGSVLVRPGCTLRAGLVLKYILCHVQ